MEKVFSAKPKRFHIHRKSPLASKLKSSISAKLTRFLAADYTDEILLEYITVMVCNGKDQYQARDDLGAFLGQRSEEFVSWLWNILVKYAGKLSTDSERNSGAKVDGCSDLPCHADKILMKGDKMPHSACDPASGNNMKRAKVSQNHPSVSVPSNEVKARVELSHACRNEIPRTYMATRDIDGEEDRNIRSTNQIAQNVNRQSSGLHRERVHLPKRETLSKSTEFSISGHLFHTQNRATNKLGISLSQSVGAEAIGCEIPRGSVWDRLGKPCDEIYGGQKNAGFYGVGHNKQYENVHDLRALIPPKRISKFPALDKKRSYSSLDEMKKEEHGGTAVSEPHFGNNIGQKRLFGQISTCLDTGSALVDHSLDPECKDISQKFKKPNVASIDLMTNPKQQLLDVKEKLIQIQIEMSKLWSKQVEFEKCDWKPNQGLSTGALKGSEETFESRTVLVTNVHYAATREALSLYFSKCGAVVDVMLLTDTITSKPKGCAYVTFASKGSVEKAVALTGATFFCRTLKVLKTPEAAMEASAPAQLAGKTSINIPFGNRNAHPSKPHNTRSTLQWRREPSTAPSEHSCPASVQGVSCSAQVQYISS